MANTSSKSLAQSLQRGIVVWLGAAALILLGVAAAPLLADALDRLVMLLHYPYPHDGLEGTLLHEARLLWAGEQLYQPLELYRFVSAPYPPLHPLLLGLADGIPGPHMFWGGRLVSLVAALGVAMLIVLIVSRAAGSWLAGLLGGALFLSAPPVLLWATRIKPDLLGLFFTALGLYMATRATTAAISSGRRPWVIAAAVCFTLAFFTKQTAVAAPLAAGLALLAADLRAFLLRRKGHRSGLASLLAAWANTLTFGLTYLALTLSVWLLLDLRTGGQFTAHVWGLHRGEWWSAYLLGKFVALLAPYWPLMLLGMIALARAIGSDRALVPAWYALVAPITLLGAGETGANHNHLLETLLALSIAGAVAIGWASGYGRRSTPHPNAGIGSERRPFALRIALRGTAIALFAAQIALAYQPQPWYAPELNLTDPPERYLVFIRNTPGEILADDVGLLLAAGRTLRYDDPSTMGPAADSGVWDQGGLLQEIAERRFSAIMIPVDVANDPIDPSGRWTPEMLAAIRTHYRLAFQDTIFTYVPK